MEPNGHGRDAQSFMLILHLGPSLKQNGVSGKVVPPSATFPKILIFSILSKLTIFLTIVLIQSILRIVFG